MNNDFSHPQRQSLIGVVIMFVDTIQGTIRAMWPILIVWLFKINQVRQIYIWTGVPAVILLITLITYLKYRNFTFFLDEDNEEFVVCKGIWNKTRIAIPLDKIQQVNINQSLIQRIIGVHALEVDTAGSHSKEVSIRAIREATALSLKQRLLVGKINTSQEAEGDAIESTPIAQQQTRPFIKISTLSLLKTGITSNYIRSFAILLAFIISGFQHLDEFVNAVGYGKSFDNYIKAEIMLRFLTVIVGTMIFLTLLVNLTRTLIRYYNFKISKQQNALLLSYGLLNTKNTILKPDKVQIVTVGRNYFQKKFNINDLKIRQASGTEYNDRERKKNHIEIPGCNEDEKNVLLKFLLEKTPERGIMVKPNFRKLIFATFKSIIIPLGLYFIFLFNFPAIREYIVFVPVYTLVAALLLYFGFRNSRLFVNDDFIIKQSGAWDIDNDFIVPHKLQCVSVKQFFWQKSSNVGTVTLHTAGGTISFGLANFTKLKELVNYWLYQVETTKKNWM